MVRSVRATSRDTASGLTKDVDTGSRRFSERFRSHSRRRANIDGVDISSFEQFFDGRQSSGLHLLRKRFGSMAIDIAHPDDRGIVVTMEMCGLRSGDATGSDEADRYRHPVTPIDGSNIGAWFRIVSQSWSFI